MNLGKATKLGSLYNKIAISGLIIGIINLTIFFIFKVDFNGLHIANYEFKNRIHISHLNIV